MKIERRNHLRATPKSLRAEIHSSSISEKNENLDAEILDISRSGIRVKLNTPLKISVHDKVKISMYLPESGEPFSINCIIKNQQSHAEYGLHYDDTGLVQGSIDDLLFECVALEEDEFTFLIKSS